MNFRGHVTIWAGTFNQVFSTKLYTWPSPGRTTQFPGNDRNGAMPAFEMLFARGAQPKPHHEVADSERRAKTMKMNILELNAATTASAGAVLDPFYNPLAAAVDKYADGELGSKAALKVSSVVPEWRSVHIEQEWRSVHIDR